MPDIKAIAFFLPQFHPIPENDGWWGKGFTEWVGVTRAAPSYLGHHQPRLPADLGFYDLRLPEVREEQASLAARYGIHGFCWYHYWFDGHRLLQRPLEEVLASGRPALPFCVCWANENWTRRWDGAEHELLIGQTYSEGWEERFIADLLPALRDPRYIRVRGAALLLVYRATLLPDAAATAARWREVAHREGIGDLHLAAVQSFNQGDPTPLGFDSAVEFPPHVPLPPLLDGAEVGVDARFSGHLYDYDELARMTAARPQPEYRRFRGVMAAWDNTARRGTRAHVFHGATPERYEAWLRATAERTRAERAPEERIVFINAWNEWGEGTYLEPDQRYGHAWLAATARALGHEVEPWRGTALRVTAVDAHPAELIAGLPPGVDRSWRAPGARVRIDRAGGASAQETIELAHGQRTAIAGWAASPGADPAAPDASSFVVLQSVVRGRAFHAPIGRVPRPDITGALTDPDRALAARAGFEATLSVDAVPPGRYRLGIVTVSAAAAGMAFAPNRVLVHPTPVNGLARRRSSTLRRPSPVPPPRATRAVHTFVGPGGLRCALDEDLRGPVPVGLGQVVRVSGRCHHARADVTTLTLVLDDRPYTVTHTHLARPEVLDEVAPEEAARAVASGFFELIPIAPVVGTTEVRLSLRARLATGETEEIGLGTITLVPAADAERAASPASAADDAPLVAICLATYDPPLDLLEAQLDSIVRQTHGRWVCIVNDDASPSGVYREIARLAARDPRFRVYRNPTRLGFYANFERCLSRVPPEAELVALCDQDDAWFPDKLAASIAAFEPGVELVYSDVEIVTRDGKHVASTYWTTRRNNYTDLASLLFVNTVTGAASTFRASLLREALPFPRRIGNPYHDHWLACVALAKGRIAYVDRPLHAYRQHAGNVLGYHAPPPARLFPSVSELATWLRAPEGFRKSVRVDVDRHARGYHDDVVRLAALARVLQARVPSMDSAKARIVGAVARLDASAAQLVLEGLKYRLLRRPTSGAELYLLRARVSDALLNLYHRVNRRRIARGASARRGADGQG
jgi:glycosyltransferase involved in cell wall biosynthesis